MVPKPDAPARGRDATATSHVHAHVAASSSSTFVRAPSYSPEELAGFRDFAKVMPDAIGEKGMKGSVKELSPGDAVERGCLGTLKNLHRRGHVTFDNELTIAAAFGGQLKVLTWLLENGCPVDEALDNGCTPLLMAAQNGHGTVVRALINAGADVNIMTNESDGTTPLFAAAFMGSETIVRVLIQAGADVNMARDNGTTPLYIAAQNGHEVVVRALINAGADVNNT
jgi:hypothetical protein